MFAIVNRLKQLRAFDSSTVTPDIAARIAGTLAWNHLAEKRYANGLTVKDCESKGEHQDGSAISPWTDDLEAKGYTKTATGVEIDFERTKHKIRVFADGSAIAQYLREDGQLVNVRHTNTQIELVGLYVELGFYGLEVQDDRILRLPDGARRCQAIDEAGLQCGSAAHPGEEIFCENHATYS